MAQVPSKRYDLFIQFFEKRVTEVQKEIDKLRTFEPLYNVVKETLEKYEFDNDIKIKENDSYLNVGIIASEENHWIDFQKFAMDVCKELMQRRLRSTMIIGDITKENAWTWGWYIATELELVVSIKICFPFKGNKYLKITMNKVQREDYEYVTKWKDKE